ncbi:hypothetical protein N7490_009096 [Penicillium lividum]|nr:hypothetical protein N7490_009096 [Penicillium lividum]
MYPSVLPMVIHGPSYLSPLRSVIKPLTETLTQGTNHNHIPENCGAYDRYVREVHEGILALPPYEELSRGRWRDNLARRLLAFCQSSLSKTISLRYHVAHGHQDISVSNLQSGTLTPQARQTAIDFFNGLFNQSAPTLPVAKSALPMYHGKINESAV